MATPAPTSNAASSPSSLSESPQTSPSTLITSHTSTPTTTTPSFGGGICNDQYCSSSTAASAASSTSTHSSSSSSDNALVNYYFIFIALIICAFLLLGWLILRRRRKRLLRTHLNQQTALSRDIATSRGRLDGGRGWTYGGLMLRSRRDDGLDERGEAPPPYKPDEEEVPAPGYTGVTTGEEVGRREEGPSIPLATLARGQVGLGERGQKPPDYAEVVVEGGGEDGSSAGSLRRHGSRTER